MSNVVPIQSRKDQTPEPALLLTIPEAAQLLRISKARAYELAAAGELPTVRIGRSVRVSRQALERWIAEAIDGGAA